MAPFCLSNTLAPNVCGSVWKMRVENPSAWATSFSVFSSRKNNGQAFSGIFARRLDNSYNHCPCALPAHVTESWPLARLEVLQNSGSCIFILSVEFLSARVEREKVFGGQQYKSVHVSRQWPEVSNFVACFCMLSNMQKIVTQIIYIGPLPTCHWWCQCTDWLSATQNGWGTAGLFSTLR